LGSAHPGRCLIQRGRRRIGKSALVEEFVRHSGVPYVFHTAEIGFGGDPLAEFIREVAVSSLPDAELFREATPGNWAAALRQLAGVLPTDQASVVLDEVPYLMDEAGAFESVLQRAWDRELSRKPVLLIGSDLSMMETLTSYGRPFHQRGADMPIGPLNVGERTFTNIARAAGGIAHSTLTRATDVLVDKRIVAAELPVSLQPSKERRYRITDSYLRFYFAFPGPHLAELDRMRSDLTLERIRRGWTAWRGRAIEPLVRESLMRLLPSHGIPAAPAVGGYWTRSNDVEIDIVGADREPIPPCSR
jgi:AAA+ ATPase superfamily predicted ATPase